MLGNALATLYAIIICNSIIFVVTMIIFIAIIITVTIITIIGHKSF